jgi:hypothetical protein
MFDRSIYEPISAAVTAEEIGNWTREYRRQTDGMGLRVDNRAEFTVIVPVVQPDGPAIFRTRMKKAQIEADYWAGRLGTVHDLRICLINDDTHLLFAATYSDEFKPYVLDMILLAKPWIDHILSGVAEDYPGLESQDATLAYISKYQVESALWYGSPNPDLSPWDIAEGVRVAQSFDQLVIPTGPVGSIDLGVDRRPSTRTHIRRRIPPPAGLHAVQLGTHLGTHRRPRPSSTRLPRRDQVSARYYSSTCS